MPITNEERTALQVLIEKYRPLIANELDSDSFSKLIETMYGDSEDTEQNEDS